MTKDYSALHESMQTRTLANGLRICYLPKEGFQQDLRHSGDRFRFGGRIVHL